MKSFTGCEKNPWAIVHLARNTCSSYERFLKHLCYTACILMEIKIDFINIHKLSEKLVNTACYYSFVPNKLLYYDCVICCYEEETFFQDSIGMQNMFYILELSSVLFILIKMINIHSCLWSNFIIFLLYFIVSAILINDIAKCL